MNPAEKRFVLRMIPYGVHIVTALDESGVPVASTVHWVTQTSFTPALVLVALPAEGAAYAAIRATNRFALHMLGKDDAEAAHPRGSPSRGHQDSALLRLGATHPDPFRGLPLLHDAVGDAGMTSCAPFIEYGDHHPFIAEISEAHPPPAAARPARRDDPAPRARWGRRSITAGDRPSPRRGPA